jgi:hypothetical protein
LFGPPPTENISVNIDVTQNPLGLFLIPANTNRTITATGTFNGVEYTVEYFVNSSGLPVYASTNVTTNPPAFPTALFTQIGVEESDPETLVQMSFTDVSATKIYFPLAPTVAGLPTPRTNSNASSLQTVVSQQLISPIQTEFGSSVTFQLPVYQTATLLPAELSSVGQVVTVMDGDGGNTCLAVFDGSDWLRVPLGLPVSPVA